MDTVELNISHMSEVELENGVVVVKGYFYNPNPFKDKVKGIITDTFVIWDILDDDSLTLVAIEVHHKQFNKGNTIKIEIMDNGFLISTKNERHVFKEIFHLNNFVGEMCFNTDMNRFDFEGITVNSIEAEQKYFDNKVK